jgi:hypothetical protein
MRRYDIASGIFLILSIIDFALAAPVLPVVQEKRQARVNLVHIPRDAITVLRQRGGEDVYKLASLAEEYLKTSVESSDAHASSSSAPLGSGHGSTNVVQAPPPNPASSINPNPLMEPPSPAFESSALSDSEYDWLYEPEGQDAIHRPLNTPTSPGMAWTMN